MLFDRKVFGTARNLSLKKKLVSSRLFSNLDSTNLSRWGFEVILGNKRPSKSTEYPGVSLSSSSIFFSVFLQSVDTILLLLICTQPSPAANVLFKTAGHFANIRYTVVFDQISFLQLLQSKAFSTYCGELWQHFKRNIWERRISPLEIITCCTAMILQFYCQLKYVDHLLT